MKKFDKAHLKTAFIWAEESKCKRLKVGAVIAKDGRIISVGFNGTPEKFKKRIKLTCDKCNGTGVLEKLPTPGDLYIKKTCDVCGGSGGVLQEIKDNNCETFIKKCPDCGFLFEHFMECNTDKADNYVYYQCPKCEKTLAIYNETNRIYSGYEQQVITNPNVIHAEMNALMFAAKRGVSTDGATMYVTHAPCINCAKHILQAGIKRLVYSEDYRDLSGVELLESMIEVEKIEKEELYK